jgi:hypothetical protein
MRRFKRSPLWPVRCSFFFFFFNGLPLLKNVSFKVLPAKAKLRLYKELLQECGSLELSYLSPERWLDPAKSGPLLIKV